jgi:hypothetical protein
MSGQPPNYGSDFTMRYDDTKDNHQSAVESKQDPYEHYDAPEVGHTKAEVGSSSDGLNRGLSTRSTAGPSNDKPMDGTDQTMRDAPKFPEANAETGYRYGEDDTPKDEPFVGGKFPDPSRSSRYQDLGAWTWQTPDSTEFPDSY